MGCCLAKREACSRRPRDELSVVRLEEPSTGDSLARAVERKKEAHVDGDSSRPSMTSVNAGDRAAIRHNPAFRPSEATPDGIEYKWRFLRFRAVWFDSNHKTAPIGGSDLVLAVHVQYHVIGAILRPSPTFCRRSRLDHHVVQPIESCPACPSSSC